MEYTLKTLVVELHGPSVKENVHIITNATQYILSSENCCDGVDNDLDGKRDCEDPDCCGATCSTITCYNSDSYCTGHDPDTHTKMVFERPSGCSLTGSSYICKP